MTADAGRSDESRQVVRVLQGSLRRRERLHVHVRRQLQRRGDEAARRAVSRRSAVDSPAGNVEGRRRDVRRPASSTSASRRASSRRARRRSSSPGPFEYNQEQRIAIRAMAQVLETRLLEVLREDLGGTYSVSASAELLEDSAERIRGRYLVRVESDADRGTGQDGVPADRAAEDQWPDREAGRRRQAGVPPRPRDQQKSNGFFLTNISAAVRIRRGSGEPVQPERLLQQAVTRHGAGGREAYFNTNNYVKVALFPEKK